MAKSNSAVQQRGGFGKFFRGVKAELKKVVWPTKKKRAYQLHNCSILSDHIHRFDLFLCLMDSLPNFLIRCCTLLDRGPLHGSR